MTISEIRKIFNILEDDVNAFVEDDKKERKEITKIKIINNTKDHVWEIVFS